MAEAGLGFGALAGIAATSGPGLIGGVLVGATTGKAGANLAAFVARIDAMRGKTEGQSLKDIVEFVLRDSGLIDHYRAEPVDDEMAQAVARKDLVMIDRNKARAAQRWSARSWWCCRTHTLAPRPRRTPTCWRRAMWNFRPRGCGLSNACASRRATRCTCRPASTPAPRWRA